MKKLTETIVTFQNVAKKYDESTVLKDVSFQLEKGKFYTLLGPSGCGKTTILNLIAGFTEASTGVVSIDGQEVNKIPAHKRQVNTVFQDYALFPPFSHPIQSTENPYAQYGFLPAEASPDIPIPRQRCLPRSVRFPHPRRMP